MVYVRDFQKKWGPLPSPQGAALQGGCWSHTILDISAFCPQTQPLKSLHSLLVTVAEWNHPPLTTFGKRSTSSRFMGGDMFVHADKGPQESSPLSDGAKKTT